MVYIASYKELIVWQKSIELVKEVYLVTDGLPKVEIYSLVSQMRRCVISIPSNIAEGHRRKGLGDFLRFLSIADGSAAELETQIIICKEIYPSLNFTKAEGLLEEVQKMLMVIMKKLNQKTKLNTTSYTLNALR